MLYLNLIRQLTMVNILTFNFNKCCIWIRHVLYVSFLIYLFNFNKCCIWITRYKASKQLGLNLTLTSVVFEFLNTISPPLMQSNLTLTSVVFELLLILIYIHMYKFNFNKCCIWIFYSPFVYANRLQFNFNKCCIWI